MDAKMIAPDANQYRAIEEFCACMTDVLKEWYCSLGPIRQDELQKIDSTNTVIAALHHEFLGDQSLVQKKIRKEFFDMKCCSFKKARPRTPFQKEGAKILPIKWI